MHIEIAYSGPRGQAWIQVEVPEGTTAAEAIHRSGLLERFPEMDLTTQKIGIFGRFCQPDHPVQEGDRVEIYHPARAVDEDEDYEEDD
ncbi:RnfH family protein [Ectothiorhodospira mobilis]|uniref:RnfH family protein n=1 Tax=Ectothiorhodospira mobilis TaxID=195064 RepID=UPI001EE8474E|nr:RnfH family protein [Ectothiorhodospira mobilis]MCG5535648.1 RnfH family protein [Ectothiorhodospira mobilis]